jgi:hypothetical protein
MRAETTELYIIRLLVQRTNDAFEARWIEPEGQESDSFPLSLPLGQRDKEDLRWYLEKYAGFVGAGDRVLAAELEQKIDAWGRDLYRALFEHPEGARVHLRLMEAARTHRPAILTLGSDETDVHVQPWEMIRDRRGPLVFQGVTIRRQLRGANATRRHVFTLPLSVLMIVSRPRDAGFIDPRNSIAPMLDALDALQGQVTVEFCEPPTLARLEEMISKARKQKRPYNIIHFDGHGTYLKETGVGALAFERDELGETAHFVEGRKLGDLLARLEVPLVLLEACRSSALSDRPIFGSVAPALLESGVGSVIAFSHSVHIEASRLLVERFYRELADGLTVGQALEEARARLRAEPKRWLNLGPDPETVDIQDWFIPQLYQLGADPALNPCKSSAEIAVAATAGSRTEKLHGFPQQPIYRFHGRAMELLELERAFRRNPALVLTGMGGMGKTALAREAADWWLRTKRFEVAVFHSFEQKAGTERVVQVLGQAFEGEDFSSLSAEQQWTEAVALFRNRRVLFVWDNFESTLPGFQEDEDDTPLKFSSKERQRLRKLYRDLIEASPAGRILVTCRPQETGLPGIREVPLKGLARPDSLHLLAAVLHQRNISTDRVGYEREAIDALLNSVDDHPLSISLVAPHLKP